MPTNADASALSFWRVPALQPSQRIRMNIRELRDKCQTSRGILAGRSFDLAISGIGGEC